MQVMNEKGVSKRSIARTLGVDEKTVRYHLRRMATGATDGRGRQESLMAQCGLEEAARTWWDAQVARCTGARQPSIVRLHRWLQETYGYRGSYKSVRKWVRSTYPPPPVRAFRRIETPPGAQQQIDWKESVAVDIGDTAGPTRLNAFLMQLSHSRAMAVVWSRRRDAMAWQHCHNEAFRRLGGVAAVSRVDNCKTAVARGSGAWGTINPVYQTYATQMRFYVDACRVRSPHEKGKVERAVQILEGLGIFDKCYQDLSHLQAYTDEKIAQSQAYRICPATGTTIAEAFARERARLQPLPDRLPEPYDLVKTVTVHKDAMIHFEAHQYQVPVAYVGQPVEARGGVRVQIIDPKTGAVIADHPRHTAEVVVLDPTLSEDVGDAAVLPPTPLGKMTRRLLELQAMEPARRPIDLYATLAEVAR